MAEPVDQSPPQWSQPEDRGERGSGDLSTSIIGIVHFCPISPRQAGGRKVGGKRQ